MVKNITFKVLLLVFVSWDVFAFMQEDDSYYKPSGSIRTLEQLVGEMSQKRRIKTLDLSEVPYINIDDHFVKILSDSESATSMININLSNTRITEASLEYILNGKWGTKRNSNDYKLSHKYCIPVSEVLFNVTGTTIKTEELSTFEQFSIKKRDAEPLIKIRYLSDMSMLEAAKHHGPMFQEFNGMRVLYLVNKPFSKVKDNIPFRIVKKITLKSGVIYVSMTKEEKDRICCQPSAAASSKQIIQFLPSSNLGNLTWPELAKRYEQDLRKSESACQRLNEERTLAGEQYEQKLRESESACQRLNEEKNSFVRKMILAEEPDEKILQYTEISLEKLRELKSSLRSQRYLPEARASQTPPANQLVLYEDRSKGAPPPPEDT